MSQAQRGGDAVGHLMLPAEVGGHELVLEGQQTDDGLDAARSTGGVARKRLGARHQGHLLGEHPTKGGTLRDIVVGRARAVGIDILDILRLQASHREGLRHRLIGTFAIVRRGRLVEGITGIAVAPQPGVDGSLTARRHCLRLHHDVGRTLA